MKRITACGSPMRAIVAAATLSNRYITDRFLPDKAIDLMDEAASRLRMQIDSKPEELDELDRGIMQLKIEREALKKETDAGSKDRLKRSRRSWPSLQEKADALTAKWQEEKDKLVVGRRTAGAARQGEERTRRRAAPRRFPARRRIALWRHSASSRRKLKATESRRRAPALVDGSGDRRKHRAGRVALDRHSGRPDARRRARKAAADGGRARQARGRPGRGGAAVSNAVRRARAGLQDPNRPIGSFLFLGPDGRRQDRADQGARRNSCSTTSTRSCASTCGNSWRSMRWRG